MVFQQGCRYGRSGAVLAERHQASAARFAGMVGVALIEPYRRTNELGSERAD